MNLNTSPLLSQILWRVMPTATAVVLLANFSIALIIRGQHFDESQQYLDAMVRSTSLELTKNMRLDIELAEALAANDLLVNVLIRDPESDQYLQLFLRSLRLGRHPESFTLVDVDGGYVAGNQSEYNSNGSDWLQQVIETNDSYWQINAVGDMLIAVPVRYFDRVVGALVIENKNVFGEFFKTLTELHQHDWQVLDGNNKTLYSFRYTQQPETDYRKSDNAISVRHVLNDFAPYSLQGSINEGHIQSHLNQVYLDIVTVMLINLSALLGGIYMAGSTISRPLRKFIKQIRQIDVSRPLAEPVLVQGPAELQQLADSFNEVSSRLAHSRQNLQHSRNKMDLILETAGEGIVMVAHDRTIGYINTAALDMLGWNRGDAIGQPARNFRCKQCDEKSHSGISLVDKTIEKGVSHRVSDEFFQRADGSGFPVEYHCTPIFEEGLITGAVLIFSDVSERIQAETERRNIEQQMRTHQKLEAVGQLASGIAHEINTPTQFVSDNSHFLSDVFDAYMEIIDAYQQLKIDISEGKDTAKTIALIDERLASHDIDYLKKETPLAIQQSLDGLQRIAKIVQAMKEFSHPGSRQKTVSSINRAIETSIDLSRNEWKYVADLITDLDPNLPGIPIHVDEFHQVILNLIVNAAHAIEDASRTGQGRGEIKIETGIENEQIIVRVIDNGCGIPEHIKRQVFDPFFTTKEVGKGTGQGLAIAWSVIVDRHGGSFEVDSKPGQGSTFTIGIPLE